jgi:hypothetical protein
MVTTWGHLSGKRVYQALPHRHDSNVSVLASVDRVSGSSGRFRDLATLLRSQSVNWIDARRSTGRQVTGQQCYEEK